ncbi:hypothetical protein HanRHA438_Chr11g0503081 [Helianthus annuus]|uniref:Uncharacterized protein n=1 Tax=Helianthus annuus TaxID=4232 RepID=A0A251TAU2_HELAN|nr:hypothetical protein HanXRQr2_Chr11g0490391 [Helianthus annuus]KAJ0501539.1 hypothetical protein HanHA300_Chr11g0401911 [Helianthus annuus]KAJ0509352.1 hypothetical protein HanIR_Chr11g0527851 [Helianthus annuus]KAJ0517446.1 hypothetical protein HanHA89_Chr11g0425421 [Helianthus annuus]KAJ0685456.1 hypothetical protein HanLR1_Chr11g0402861 [Helianthus annuus]
MSIPLFLSLLKCYVPFSNVVSTIQPKPKGSKPDILYPEINFTRTLTSISLIMLKTVSLPTTTDSHLHHSQTLINPIHFPQTYKEKKRR